MAVAIPNTSVIIEDEEYSILSNPNAKSSLVRHEIDHILGHLDLSVLINDFERAGKLVRLAFYAAKSAGYDNMVEMKMKIYDLGRDITKLSSKSAQTVSSFRSASWNALQELHAAYEFLLQGFEEDAVDCFDTLSETAEKMAAEARALQKDFEDEQGKVRNTIQRLEEIEEVKAGNKQAAIDRRTKLNEREKEFKKRIEELKQLEKKAKENKEKYERKRDEEIENYEDPGFLVNFGRLLTGAKDPVKERVKEWREESVKLYEIEKKHRKMRNETLEKETEIMAEIQTCNIKEGDLTAAIKSLQAVNNALMQLADIMEAAVDFWVDLEKECKNISDSNFKKFIERGIAKQTEEKRLEYWHTNGFKIQAVKYCVKWVALHAISSKYIEGIRPTQSRLRAFTTENPSLEEAQSKIGAMIAELQIEAKKMKSDNEKLDLVADDEIKKLRGADDDSTANE